MREVNGYFFIARIRNKSLKIISHPLFGLDPGLENIWESAALNNFTPYETFRDAETAARKFFELKKPRAAIPVHISMEVAEREEELERLKDRDNLVVLINRDGVKDLAGPYLFNRSIPYFSANAIMALMQWNNYLPFSNKSKRRKNISWTTGRTPFEQANYAAREFSRQADGAPAQIASFEMTRFPSIQQ
jgi:hypothetical protein